MPQTQPYNPNPGGLNIQSGNDNQLQAPGFVGGQLNSSGTVNPATLQQASSAPLTPPQPGPSAAAAPAATSTAAPAPSLPWSPPASSSPPAAAPAASAASIRPRPTAAPAPAPAPPPTPTLAPAPRRGEPWSPPAPPQLGPPLTLPGGVFTGAPSPGAVSNGPAIVPGVNGPALTGFNGAPRTQLGAVNAAPLAPAPGGGLNAIFSPGLQAQ